MPDISMCKGKTCPLKESCYRYTATPNEFRQSYFTAIPYNEETKECKYLMENKTNGKLHNNKE